MQAAPPIHGAPPPHHAAPGQVTQQYAAPQPQVPKKPASRIDPSQMPRPVDTKQTTAVVFRSRGDVTNPPPMASSLFTVVDEGNCSPRFMRPTLHQIPTTKDMITNQLPLAVTLQPMAECAPGEEPVNVVDFGESGPIRCTRCKAYINPFVTFIEHGARWQCNICTMVNTVPRHYICGLDASGQRRDAAQRPELSRGSVDLVVTKDYCVRPVQEPIYVFILDASPASVTSGLLKTAIDAIRMAIDYLPGGARTRVGIVSFSAKIQFYFLRGEAAEPSFAVVGDVEDPFGPLPPNQWLMSVHQSKAQIDKVLDALPDLAASSSSSDLTASIAALEAVADGLHSLGGRVLFVSAARPTVGRGSLPNREAYGDYSTPAESKMYSGIGAKTDSKHEAELQDLYTTIADSCAARQICVDMFLCSPMGDFLDAATLGSLCKATGGTFHHMIGHMAQYDNATFLARELHHAVVRGVANETVLKLRCSSGLACERYFGPGVERVHGELEIAGISSRSTITCMLRHEGERLKSGTSAYLQSALLYSSTDGRRMVRVQTVALPITDKPGNFYRFADLESIIAVIARTSATVTQSEELKVVRENATKQCVDVLHHYRVSCASGSPSGQLILPESIKLLPLFSLGLMKSTAFRSNCSPGSSREPVDTRADERAAMLLLFSQLPVLEFSRITYPKLYALHDMGADVGSLVGEGASQRVQLPKRLSCSSEHLSSSGVFLLDAGLALFIYVGRDVPGEMLQVLFGVPQVMREGPPLQLVGAGQLADQVRGLIQHLQADRAVWPRVQIALAGTDDATERRFVSLLVEDKTRQDVSYVDYLCAVHRQIQTKLLA